MGDGTVLTDAGTPVESPADASLRMLEKRAPKGFSQRVNYAALGKIYGDRRHGESRAGSEASTPAPDSTQVATPSTASQSPEPGPIQAVLPTPAATQVSPNPGPETSDDAVQPVPAEDEEAGAEDDDEDEGDYWPDEEAQSNSPHYEDEEEFEAATEDVTGDFGIGDNDLGGDDDGAW